MPQMSPINWLTLMAMFSLTMMLFFNLNFFSIYSNPKNNPQSKENKPINWKW